MNSSSTAPTRRSQGFPDRVLAEAVRAWECSAETEPSDVEQAEQRAREVEGDFEARLLTRAGALDIAAPLRDALGQISRTGALIVATGFVLALAAGGAAAPAALWSAPGEPVNFYVALGGLLGIQTALLVVWIIALLIGIRSRDAAAVGALGRIVVAAGRGLTRRLYAGPHQLAALEAHGRAALRGGIGRWTFSAVTHACWSAFNIGVIVLALLLLSARHYTFAWETTILDDSAYRFITELIARPPAAVGFAVPDDAQIAASRWPGDAADLTAASGAWSGLLVGSLVVYGLVPRLVLLVASLLLRARAIRRYRLDVDDPEFLRLRDRLMPGRRALGIIDSDDATAPAHDRRAGARPQPSAGAVGLPMIVGIEMGRPECDWPPRLHGVRWHDLGFVEGRDDRRRVAGELASAAPPPRTVVAVCALTTTPDRGVATFLKAIGELTSQRLALVLTGGEAMRRRASEASLAARVDDWRRLADTAGIDAEHVLELDLDHATDASLARLASLVGDAKQTMRAETGHLEEAFDLIAARASRWTDEPSDRDRTDLAREIVGLYRADGQALRRLFRLPSDLASDLPARLRDGASGVIDLLPARLRVHPGWLAAGAVAGVLGCVAAATLVAPAAIASLPMWSATGAGLGAVVRACLGARPHADAVETPDLDSLDQAVRSSALLAMLLELQGLDEVAITRVLDRALPDDSTVLSSRDEIRPWLDDLHGRFEQARRSEGRP